MFVSIVAALFAIVCLVAWAALFPAARDAWADALGRAMQRGRAVVESFEVRTGARVRTSAARVRLDAGGLRGWTATRAPMLVAALLLLGLPPLLVLTLRERPHLEMFHEAPTRGESNVLSLLRGERLVPPAELPPDVFLAAEVAIRELAPTLAFPEKIVSADRRWNRIDPDLQQRVLAVYRVMREQYGIEMALVEGYRSPERQAELAREGKATRAGAGMSCHQHGLGVDSAPLRNGKLQWDMDDPWTKQAYFLYGRLSEEAGLEWGGNWRSLKDYVHVEAKAACRAAIRAARAG